MRTPVLTLLFLSLLAHCTAHAACDPNIPADVTGDCKVNFNDFAILAADWLQSSDMEAESKWVARYDGPTNESDWGFAIAVDSNDNIYVTGWSYDSATDFDYATVKYSPDSNEAVWVARYNGSGNFADDARAIAVDSQDSIYVTGYSYGSDTEYDYATIKYSPDSNRPIWVARYDGPANSTDKASAIAVDSEDNIYVTGSSYSSSTGRDYATIKYSPDSNQPVWVARYTNLGNNIDIAFAIAVDSEDSIYVTGSSYGFGTNRDYATVKYSPDSNEAVWVARYTGPGNYQDEALAIAVDSEDNIYVTGYCICPGTSSDYATIKYSPDSNEPVWVARYNGPGFGDYAYAIAVDSNDNIYVTGRSFSSGTSSDYATVKYSPDSNEAVWVARYNGSGNFADDARAIAVDSKDNIYVTGGSTSFGTSGDYTTIKYSPDSNEAVWVARYDGPTNKSDWAFAIAVDSEDSIYVTGYSTSSGTGDDYATIKYAPEYTCTPQITGDFDHNCTVDIYDLAIFCRHWLECNLDPPEACWE